MKAKVIATGRVVDVVKTTRKKTIHDYFGSQNDIEIVVYYDGKNQYTESELEFDVSSDPDYWTRLEHQYAGMAMQGLVTRGKVLGSSIPKIARDIAELSYEEALSEGIKEAVKRLKKKEDE